MTEPEKKHTATPRKKNPQMEETQKLLGKRISSLRKQLSLTQEQLAQKAGITQKYLSEIERGNRNISIPLISALANGLGVSQNVIFECEHEQGKDALLAEVIRMSTALHDGNRLKDLQMAYRLLKMLTE